MTDPEPEATEKVPTLAEVLQQYQIVLPPDQVAKLDEYRQLLWQWNEKINLTRHTTYERFVTRDVVDSQQLAQLLRTGERVLDMGSGGGVPGVVVQILRPDVHVELCECIGKKARVLLDICQKLNLPSKVHACRIEEVLSGSKKPYDTVVARGVGPLWKVLKVLRPYWGRFGRLLLIKGPNWVKERGEARHRGMMHGLNLRRAAVYTNPGEQWKSVILLLWPKEEKDKVAERSL